MKAALFLSLSSLLSSTLAIHARHANFHNKRDVAPPPLDWGCCKTVVTVTVYEDEPTSTSTWYSTTTSVVVVSDTGAPPPPPPASTTGSAAPPAASGPPAIAPNGNKWAMTYTQYNTDGTCRAAADVMTDLAAIKAKGFTAIRMYGTDCSGLQNVGAAARAAGLKIIVGVFIEASGIGAAQPQVGEIASWGQSGNWDLVIMIVVGNEAISSGYCDGPSLAAFISSARGSFQAAGSGSIPVTTSETVAAFVSNAGSLCGAIDVVAANVQTFFDGGVVAGDAGTFAQTLLGQIETACPGKPSYNLESGWPSAGGDNKLSLANPTAQAAAIAAISGLLGDKTVMFSFGDDAWKPPGVEQHFGCAQLF